MWNIVVLTTGRQTSAFYGLDHEERLPFGRLAAGATGERRTENVATATQGFRRTGVFTGTRARALLQKQRRCSTNAKACVECTFLQYPPPPSPPQTAPPPGGTVQRKGGGYVLRPLGRAVDHGLGVASHMAHLQWPAPVPLAQGRPKAGETAVSGAYVPPTGKAALPGCVPQYHCQSHPSRNGSSGHGAGERGMQTNCGRPGRSCWEYEAKWCLSIRPRHHDINITSPRNSVQKCLKDHENLRIFASQNIRSGPANLPENRVHEAVYSGWHNAYYGRGPGIL